MDLINDFFERLYSGKTIFIHVIGDSMIDEDLRVQATRISPECPNVNVLLSEDDRPFSHPGGAANVCYQLRNFNVICRLFSFVDVEAYHIIKDKGVKYWGLVELPKGHRIPRKRRMYANGLQVVRLDIERPTYGLDVKPLQNQLIRMWEGFQAEAHVVIFSDYNKGVFKDFDMSRINTNAITIVDSKSKPLERWRGCTVFKPNAKEAYELTGISEWKGQCDYLQEKLGCKAVLITQAGDGVVGKINDYFEYKSNIGICPVDIVGAGDCFGGILAMAMSLGFDVEEAAKIAFHGGLLCVQQKERGSFGPWLFSKTIKNSDFLKNRNFKLVATNGCFDILHAGHLQSLQFAKSKGDKLLVMVNSDESIKRLKGETRPIMSLQDRMKVLAALDCVDFILSFSEDTPLELIKSIKPDVLVKGEDWRDKEVAGAEYVKEVCYAPLLEGHSTTEIVKKL